MEQSPSWESNSHLASQEIFQLSQKTKVHYCTHRSPHWSLSWARCIHSTLSHPTSLISILILSFHLCLSLPDGLYPSGFQTKTSPHIYNHTVFIPFFLFNISLTILMSVCTDTTHAKHQSHVLWVLCTKCITHWEGCVYTSAHLYRSLISDIAWRILVKFDNGGRECSHWKL